MNSTKDDEKDYQITMCKCCMLADAMKTCKTGCPFAIGLIYRQLDQVKALPIEYPDQLRQARLSNLKLSNV